MMKKMSAVWVLAVLLIASDAGAQETQNPKAVWKPAENTVPSCTNDDLKKYDFCINKDGKLSIITETKTSDHRRTNRFRLATEKERIAMNRPKQSGVKPCEDTTLIEGDYCVAQDDHNLKRVIFAKDKKIILNGSSKTINKFRAITPVEEMEFNRGALTDFCGGLMDRIIDRDDELKEIRTQIDLIGTKGDQKQLQELKAKQERYSKNSSTENCTLKSSSDIYKQHWDSCNTTCLETALDGCQKLLTEKNIGNNKKNKNLDNSYCSYCQKVSHGQSPIIRYMHEGVNIQYGAPVNKEKKTDAVKGQN